MATKSEQKAALAVIEEVEDKVHVFRGQRVMLDSDLAEVYQVETRVLKQAVRRNRHRFPDDFLFELTVDETASVDRSRSQTVTLNRPQSKRGSCGKCKEPTLKELDELLKSLFGEEHELSREKTKRPRR